MYQYKEEQTIKKEQNAQGVDKLFLSNLTNFDGKNPKLPTGTDAMYALTAAMTAYARTHKEDMARISYSITYADRMPPDFSAMLMKDYMAIEKDYRAKLLQIPSFARWLSSKGRLINGVVK